MINFFQFFTERHMLANLFTLGIVILGVFTLTKIQRDNFPKVDMGKMTVTTYYPGASAEDVELNVTNKIEDELKSVSGLNRVESFSMENMSTIVVNIDIDEKDQDKIKSDIRDAVSRVSDLPSEVSTLPIVKEINTSIVPILEIGLSGNLPYKDIRKLVDQFEKKLEETDGVSSINKFGYRAREIKIEVSPTAIKKYQIPLNEILGAIQGRNVQATSGTFESFTSEKNIVTLAQFKDPQEVGDVIVRSTFDGLRIKVKDLAIINDAFADEKVVTRMNGNTTISLVINKKENADIIRTVDALKALVEEEKEYLPEGVDIMYSGDLSRQVRSRMEVVFSNGAAGLVLVVLVLSLFLNFRTSFWAAMGIPVTMLGIIFLLPTFGMNLNVISLGGMILVIGIIVDDAIIVAENIHRHLELGKPPLKAAVDGMQEVFWPVITAMMTTLLAFSPMFFMSGIMGKFIYVMPLVVSLALLISLVELVVALPSHLIGGKGDKKSSSQGRTWFKPVQEWFRGIIFYVLKFRYPVVVLFLALLVFTGWFAKNNMSFILMPNTSAELFTIRVELPVGTSLAKTAEKVTEIDRLIESLPKEELESYVSRVGRLSGFASVEKENIAEFTITLTPFAERARTADIIVEELKQKSLTFDGYDKISYTIKAGGPPVGSPITITVIGEEDARRTALADSIETVLKHFNGVKDLDRDDKAGKDQIELKINYDKLAQVGLTVSDVSQSVRLAYDGQTVTSIRFGQEDVDFVVSLQEKVRHDLSYLSNLLIPNRKGRLIPLKEVAWFKTGPGPSNFYHYNNERSVTITGDVDQNVTTPVLATTYAMSKIDLKKDWKGMRVKVGGESEETQKSFIDLGMSFLLAAIGIYFLLTLLFNSLTQPLMVMMAIPFGLIGVIAAFIAHGEPLSFMAMLGVVGLSGVVVNDSLILVDHINELRKKDPDKSILDVVIEGTTNRFRPIILTTLTTVSGLLPLAYGVGGSDPIMAPMALAIGYGILFATFLILGLVPSLYLIGDDLQTLFKRA